MRRNGGATGRTDGFERRLWVALFATGLVMAAACSSGPDPTPSASTSGPTPQPSPSVTASDPLADRMETTAAALALDFVAPGAGGGEVRGLDYLGRDVVLWFFAPW